MRMNNMEMEYLIFMEEFADQSRSKRIEAAIKDFIMMAKNGYDINDNDIQEVILEDHRLQDLTYRESITIAREVERCLNL